MRRSLLIDTEGLAAARVPPPKHHCARGQRCVEHKTEVTNDSLIGLVHLFQYIEFQYRNEHPDGTVLNNEEFRAWSHGRVHAALVEFESGRAKLPKQIRESEATVAAVIEKAEELKLRDYLDSAWSALSEDERAEFCARFNARILKAINGGGGPLEARTKELVLLHVAKIADEVVSQRVEEIRAQVTKEVDRRWQETVEAVVTKMLSQAIAKVKAEMVGP